MESKAEYAFFAYNFPHKKTQDFLLRLALEGLIPTVVLAANWVELPKQNSTLRTKPRHIDLVPPKVICDQFEIPYFVVDHNGDECNNILDRFGLKFGLIGGARILNRKVIKLLTNGIINMHPGILPFCRGLDALKWAIYENTPIGVTAHIIDERVDAGLILTQKEISLVKDDTLIDLGLKLEQMQTTLVPEIVSNLKNIDPTKLTRVDTTYKPHTMMPPEIEKEIPRLLQERLSRL
jgi:phosphoribosylglycinamide formyltransferase-1